MKGIKAFLFDWDGVFNDGEKKENGSSAFKEIEAMGTNLLRLNHFILHGKNPYVAVITGEKNEYAFRLAEREHFHAVYFRIKHKVAALEHFCNTHDLQPEEIAFFFDDVLDFSVPPKVGLRMMIGRKATPLLSRYAGERGLADYITANDGNHHGLREAIELMMGLSGQYDATLDHRIEFNGLYQEYLSQRDLPKPSFFTADPSGKIVTPQ